MTQLAFDAYMFLTEELLRARKERGELSQDEEADRADDLDVYWYQLDEVEREQLEPAIDALKDIYCPGWRNAMSGHHPWREIKHKMGLLRRVRLWLQVRWQLFMMKINGE